MVEEMTEHEETQADFIRNELNFQIDPNNTDVKASSNDHPLDEWIDILGNGQLKKKVLKPGENDIRPNRGDICTLKITGKLTDDTLVEDHDNLVVQSGDIEVVQGLDLAIALMNVHEIAEIQVHSRFAYGKLGKQPEIPPDAVINYIVELKAIELEPEIDTLSVIQRREIGNKKRERGNWWFMRDESTLAIQCYRRALDFLLPPLNIPNLKQNDVEESVSNAELQTLLEDRMKVYNNLAAAQIKTQAYDVALESVENVLVCQPQNVKALYRKGKILHFKGQHTQAYATLLQAAKLEPESKDIQIELAILRKKNAKDARHEKNLYRKMLGTSKNISNLSKKMRKDDKSNISGLVWSLLGGASAVIVGLILYRFSS